MTIAKNAQLESQGARLWHYLGRYGCFQSPVNVAMLEKDNATTFHGLILMCNLVDIFGNDKAARIAKKGGNGFRMVGRLRKMTKLWNIALPRSFL